MSDQSHQFPCKYRYIILIHCPDIFQWLSQAPGYEYIWQPGSHCELRKTWHGYEGTGTGGVRTWAAEDSQLKDLARCEVANLPRTGGGGAGCRGREGGARGMDKLEGSILHQLRSLEVEGPGQHRPTGVGQLDGLRGRGRYVCMYGRISRINRINRINRISRIESVKAIELVE